MDQVGFIGTTRHGFTTGSIIWPTHDVGLRPPNLLRQTTRHELTVAAVSARYLAHGYQWQRDRRPEFLLDHQADGVATKDGQVELIEVELTPKHPADIVTFSTAIPTDSRMGSTGSSTTAPPPQRERSRKKPTGTSSATPAHD